MKKFWIVPFVIAVSLLVFSLIQSLKPKPPFSEPGEELWLEIRSGENGSELLLNNWEAPLDICPTSGKVESFLLILTIENQPTEIVEINSLRYGEFRKYGLKMELRSDQVVKYELFHKQSGLRLNGQIVVNGGPIFIGKAAKGDEFGWINVIRKENGTFLQAGSFTGYPGFWLYVSFAENENMEEFYKTGQLKPDMELKGRGPWRLKKDLRPGDIVWITMNLPQMWGSSKLEYGKWWMPLEVNGRNFRYISIMPL
jgi:hypothetical protein